MQFHKGGICLHRKGDKKKNVVLLKPDIFFLIN